MIKNIFEISILLSWKLGIHKLMRKYYYDYKFSFNQDFLKNIQDKKERKFQKIVCYYLPYLYISILYILLGLPMSLVLSFVTTWCMRFFTFLTKFLKPFINVVYGSICIIATSRSFRIFYKVFSGSHCYMLVNIIILRPCQRNWH